MSTKRESKDKWENFENSFFVYPIICFIVYIGSDLITDNLQSVAHYGWIGALFLSVWIVVAQILKVAEEATQMRTARAMALLEGSKN